MEMISSENSVIWAPGLLAPCLPWSRRTDLSFQLCYTERAQRWTPEEVGSSQPGCPFICTHHQLFGAHSPSLPSCPWEQQEPGYSTCTGRSANQHWAGALLLLTPLRNQTTPQRAFSYCTGCGFGDKNLLSTSEQSCFYTSPMHR